MSTAHSPNRPRDAVDPDWTSRQRQVLDLLTKGRTNTQIAEALGISRDGAKWHVSEVLSKLGVDSREEAAGYWRARNGLRLRFTRMFGALIPGAGWLKVAGAVSGVGVVVAGLAVFFALRGSGSSGGPIAETTATVAASTTAVSTPAGTLPTTGETIDGVPVRALTIGSDAQVPSNLAVYYSTMCYACGPLEPPAYRAYTDASGQLHIDDLLAPLKARYGRNPYSRAASPSFAEIVAVMCTKGYCGGESAASADAEAKIVRSTDGGVTWTEVQNTVPNTFVAGVVPGLGTVMVTYESNNGARYWLLESDQDLLKTGGADGPWPSIIPGLGLTWMDKSGTLRDTAGNLVFSPRHASPQGFSPEAVVEKTPDGSLYTTWRGAPSKTGDPATTYLGKYDASMKLVEVYSWTGTDAFRPKRLLSPSLLLGDILLSASPPASGDRMFPYEAAVFDLKSGAIHPMPQLSAGLKGNNNPFIDGFSVGPFARVKTGTDCLNVRETASTSSTSLGCFADGVLLQLRQEPDQSSGGATWVAVEAPDGKPGWASADYLQR